MLFSGGCRGLGDHGESEASEDPAEDEDSGELGYSPALKYSEELETGDGAFLHRCGVPVIFGLPSRQPMFTFRRTFVYLAC